MSAQIRCGYMMFPTKNARIWYCRQLPNLVLGFQILLEALIVETHLGLNCSPSKQSDFPGLWRICLCLHCIATRSRGSQGLSKSPAFLASSELISTNRKYVPDASVFALPKTVAVVDTTSPPIAPNARVPRCAMVAIVWLRRIIPRSFSKLPRNIHDCIVTIALKPSSRLIVKPRSMKLVQRSR